MEFRVGTGGWQYLPVETVDKLRSYSKIFDFVEVNSTFYSRIPLGTVARWREVVPPEFEFAVKCSREVTPLLRSGDRSRLSAVLEYMSSVCEVLGSDILVLQTPSRLDPSRASEGALLDLANHAEIHSLRLAWEVRSNPTPELLSFFKAHGIVQVTDLSRAPPVLPGEVIYSRLFGRGRHNLYRFTTEDFRRIEDGAVSSRAKKAYFAFHGVAMYADALRFKKSIRAGQTS